MSGFVRFLSGPPRREDEPPKAHHRHALTLQEMGLGAVEEVQIAVAPRSVLAYPVPAPYLRRPHPGEEIGLDRFPLGVRADLTDDPHGFSPLTSRGALDEDGHGRGLPKLVGTEQSHAE
jgi:hypothetical protein